MLPLIKRNRELIDEKEVFTQNAWDNTEWTSDMLNEAKAKIESQKLEAATKPKNILELELQVTDKWNDFYETHGDKFFKDRQWIFSEFPEILNLLQKDSPPTNIFEVGCGVGNAVAHIINYNNNPDLHIFCCDLSSKAIETLKTRDFFRSHEQKVTAFKADICENFQDVVLKNIEKESLDFITLIFTLSALKPEKMQTVIKDLSTILKPGGIILLRDYAQYDLTQLRFKGKAYLGDNYYIRADGTTSYFFTRDSIEKLFSCVNLLPLEVKNDNRLLVNRAKSLKMCRCWIQAKYMKPIDN